MNQLRALIADRIRTNGPISFAEYMDLALYHPSLGYYARASLRTGRAGDFFTSVDVGPLFGEMLSAQFGEMWRILQANPEPDTFFDLVEAGAGSGRLALDILDGAARLDPEFYARINLHLVERSAAARAAQRGTLGPHATRLRSAGEKLPGALCGAIFANELLDALPTHPVVMTESGLREVFVALDGSRLVERLGEPSTGEIAEYLSRAGAALRPGWRAEVNLAAVEWVRDAARRLERGFLVIVDYGHDAAELYSASHATGTLTTFHRHTTSVPGHADDGPVAACLADPGEYDITAHVDLTALTHAAEAEGLSTLGRLDQTYFLLGLGLTDLFESDQTLAAMTLQRRLALKTLMLPGGLGSTHKVLIFGKGVGNPKLRGCSYRMRLT